MILQAIFISNLAFGGAPSCRDIFQATNVSPRQYALPHVEYSLVKLKDVFGEDGSPAVIGFGQPNVFILRPDGAGGTERLAAKSLRMTPARVEDARGFAQSGLFLKLNPAQVTPEMLAALGEGMKSREGTKSWTCVNSVCAALDRAGFTSGGEKLDEYFPVPLLQRLLRDGLEWNGSRVEVEIINTTPDTLPEFVRRIEAAQKTTLLRHFDRHWRSSRLRAHVVRLREGARQKIGLLLRRSGEEPAAAEAGDGFWESQPSVFGRLVSALTGSRQLIEFDIPDLRLTVPALPQPLRAFERKPPSFMKSLKKNLLFAPPVTDFLLSQLRASRVAVPCPGGCETMPFLAPSAPGRPEAVNFVMTADRLVMTRLHAGLPWADWILSKHVLIAGHDPGVRFAGEMWRDAAGRVHVTNDSGTYAPTAEQLRAAVGVLRKLFPATEFAAEPI